ncbi:hypothetical protein AXF42_Ash013893 [Apostasia shenzhenica]|uniref:At2g35280-like TPR domain-containing protein n=1 Tax=Apostasia shenzhenica TaxID=1088818 RepID=A0A2I0AS69_9ASPA|nr:hypothetical protein AXF42_Ash013893 [Apostasia shenzhenica]
MAVEDWTMLWEDKNAYVEFLRRCAAAENLDANFLIGLEEIYNQGRQETGFHHLQLASRGGHLLALYLIGYLLFLDGDSRCVIIDMLKGMSSREAKQCRWRVVEILSEMTWERGWLKRKINGDRQCEEDESCGEWNREESDQWLGEKGVERKFCSEGCRWRHEYLMFCSMI